MFSKKLQQRISEVNFSRVHFTMLQCVREKQNFLQVREKSGNFEKTSGNFGHLTHVRELSGNFVMSCQGILL